MPSLRRSAFLVAAAATLLGSATAQLVDTPAFSGLYYEEFDSSLPNNRTLQNTASIVPSPGGQFLLTYGWLVYVGYAVYPLGQSNSFLGTSVGHAVLTFDTPVQRVGAWFATVGYLPGGYANLYDDGNNLLATKPLAAPRGGPWMWDGWDAGPHGPKIKRVELFANDPYNNGALLCIENLQADIHLGTITSRATGCGGLGIAASGLPVIGDTVTFTMTGASGFSGYAVGFPASTPINGCPSCTLGVNGTTVIGSQYLLDIPHSTAWLDLTVAVQGFSLAGGPCLSVLKVSDSVDVRIGE
ncbi:MAG: hypothetical protein U1E73_00150 [Planctomycetota bacterium]